MNARPVLRLALFLVCGAILGPPWAGAAEPTGTRSEIAGIERASDLGPWTGGDGLAAELRTPRSALETFLEAGEDGPARSVGTSTVSPATWHGRWRCWPPSRSCG